MRDTNSRELVDSVSSRYQYILGENRVKIFLRTIFWWMGWCRAEFADLVLQALTRVLTDGWTVISSNWWCQLGIFTFLPFQVEDKYSDELYFPPPSFFGLFSRGEFERPVCSTGDRRKGAAYAYMLTYFLPMAVTISNLNVKS